ncbi:MAG TPA: hypothetical protein DCG69_08180 [Bacteroidales bacterium]|nr:hypothetical protein [Bacteroidales bacterium]
MKRTERYLQIKSLSQLQHERLRLENEISKNELKMNLQYSDLKQSLSITHFLTSLASKISLLIPAIQIVQNIYDFVLSKWQSGKKNQAISETEPNNKD